MFLFHALYFWFFTQNKYLNGSTEHFTNFLLNHAGQQNWIWIELEIIVSGNRRAGYCVLKLTKPFFQVLVIMYFYVVETLCLILNESIWKNIKKNTVNYQHTKCLFSQFCKVWRLTERGFKWDHYESGSVSTVTLPGF